MCWLGAKKGSKKWTQIWPPFLTVFLPPGGKKRTLSAKSASASELRAGSLRQLSRHRRRMRLAQWRLARRQKRTRMRKTRKRSAPSVTGHTRHRVDTSSRVVAATPCTLAVASHTAKRTSASRRAGARRHARQAQGLRLAAPAHLLGQARWPSADCARGCASAARPGRTRSRCAWTFAPAQTLCNHWGGPAGGGRTRNGCRPRADS
jgi:hypothetical protein